MFPSTCRGDDDARDALALEGDPAGRSAPGGALIEPDVAGEEVRTNDWLTRASPATATPTPLISAETRSARAMAIPPMVTATSSASTRTIPPWRTSTRVALTVADPAVAHADVGRLDLR